MAWFLQGQKQAVIVEKTGCYGYAIKHRHNLENTSDLKGRFKWKGLNGKKCWVEKFLDSAPCHNLILFVFFSVIETTIKPHSLEFKA